MMNDWHTISIFCPEELDKPYSGWKPCIVWCKQQFGERGSNWIYIGEGVFSFENEEDLILFKLRWG